MRTLALAFLASLTFVRAAHADLISVDFGSSTMPANFSGVEPVAAAMNSLFASANVWNSLNLPASSTNLSLQNMFDSTGTTTSVSFSVLGTVASINENGPMSPLQGDFLSSATINWKIGGLTAGHDYQLAFYGANLGTVAIAFSLFVDRNGDGLLNEPSVVVPVLTNANPIPVIISATASVAGEIIGQAAGLGGRPCGEGGCGGNSPAKWAGFQIAENTQDTGTPVPEPGSIVLFVGVMTAIGGIKLRKRKARN